MPFERSTKCFLGIILLLSLTLSFGLLRKESKDCESDDVRTRLTDLSKTLDHHIVEVKKLIEKVSTSDVKESCSHHNRIQNIIEVVEEELDRVPDFSPVMCPCPNNKDDTYPVYPIEFAIFEEKLRVPSKAKDRAFAAHIPGKPYPFSLEEEYDNDYAASYYAFTMKKGGWDCMRHWEILASGTVPYFSNLEHLPANTMRGFPRKAIEKLMKLPGVLVTVNVTTKQCCDEIGSFAIDWNVFPKRVYNRLNLLLHQYSKRHLTTRALARSMLNVTGQGNASKVLMILDRLDCCREGQSGSRVLADYLDLTVFHGFKLLLGRNFHSYPLDLEFMYDDFPAEKALQMYGKGFTYSRRLQNSLKGPIVNETTLLTRIREESYDVIIYGAPSGAGLPLFSQVTKSYQENPSRIFHLNGEDTSQPPQYQYDSCALATEMYQRGAQYGHSVFLREM